MWDNQVYQRYDEYFKSVQEDGTLMFAGKLLERAARKWPDRIAYICDDQMITYSQLYHRACAVAEKLRACGVSPEDRVIVWWQNAIEFFIAYYGVWQTGAVVAALNVFLHPKEFGHIMHDAKPKVIIISDDMRSKLDAAQQAQLPPQIDQDFIKKTTQMKLSACRVPSKDPDALAALLYTSGTTGMPKGVMLSSRNILTNTIQGISCLSVSPDDRAFIPVPLFHSLAQNSAVWGNVLLGSCAIIIPKIDRRALLKGLSYKPTAVLGVPALYGIFCMMRKVDFSTVRYFVSGGDALPDKIRAGFAQLYGRTICNGYGMTETSPLIAVQVKDEQVSSDTVGTPVIGMQCSIRDEQGHDIARGQVGTLWVKGDNVMLGYYNAPELTKKILVDGWLNTGDLACFDDQGRLRIVGRIKDLIIHKGFNIYPQEIENILLSHPQVIQAAVIGVKDGGIEEVPIAFVAVKGTLENAELVLKKLCIAHLASYKVPRTFIMQTTLPITALAKVDKKKLKAAYEQKT